MYFCFISVKGNAPHPSIYSVTYTLTHLLMVTKRCITRDVIERWAKGHEGWTQPFDHLASSTIIKNVCASPIISRGNDEGLIPYKSSCGCLGSWRTKPGVVFEGCHIIKVVLIKKRKKRRELVMMNNRGYHFFSWCLHVEFIGGKLGVCIDVYVELIIRWLHLVLISNGAGIIEV